jgi:Carboxypeptidase regulatory-like domain
VIVRNPRPLTASPQRLFWALRVATQTFTWIGLLVLLSARLSFAQSEPLAQLPPPTSQSAATVTPKSAPLTLICTTSQDPAQNAPGMLRGTVADLNGNAIPGALVSLIHNDQSPAQQASVGEDGEFFFSNIVSGPFHLSVASPGFTSQSAEATMPSGQGCVLPRITLTLATNVTEVHVELSPVEIAQEQIKDQEKQRVLGVIPNFYVSYAQHPVALSPKQKFELAWKVTFDPVTFGVTAAAAGIEQATNSFSGYGQGAQGYGKRYGAIYADFLTSTYIGAAILPSLLKQDPRYFYKGTGSIHSRAFYALANAVICKGDNGHWQPNYSGVLGSFASGAISNLYYPASDRNGISLTLENTLIQIGETAAVNLLQEFVIRRFTSNVPPNAAVNTTTP